MRRDRLTALERCKDRSLPQDVGLRGRSDSWFDLNPRGNFRLLDVGCGRGALLRQLPHLFGPLTERIDYFGYDLNYEFVAECQEVGTEIGVRTIVRTGELSALRFHFAEQQYGAIALVNVLHELPLSLVPDLLLDLLALCARDGFLYVFDVASLPYEEPEPGALAWRSDEVNSVLRAASQALGLSNVPHAAEYKGSQGGWYFFINKHSLPADFNSTLEKDRRRLVAAIGGAMLRAFVQRRGVIDDAIVRFAADMRDLQREQNPEHGGLMRLRQLLDVQFRDHWSCVSELDELGDFIDARPAGLNLRAAAR